ncbi:flagellar M-ring protein FliF [Gammaproteobacteria bacterium AH-315-E17]|nr:flagellar M-ring protein FliF [Gammaproteobacteria bacterium AH-315-E17]
MANTALAHSTLEQINSLSQLHIVRQISFVLLIAAGIALGTATVLWSTNSEYTPLFMDMSTQDSAAIIEILEQNGTDYKINANNGMLTVPGNEVQRIRLQLASSGLPRSSNLGYEMLEEEQSLGTSNFIQQARYTRALEQELVQTIKLIQGVRAARVHLSIPKQTSFIRSTNVPSASVMIDVISLQSLNNNQLQGILHLVASSVAGLQTENVSIVDQRGNLLSQQNDSEFSNSTENIRLTRQIEEDYKNRIISILTPIVGAGNVKAQVSADLNFTIIETTEETFNPNTAVIRSEQTQEESIGSTANNSSVEPGTLSPTPPLNAPVADTVQQQTDSSNQTRINATRNYEIDRSISLIRTVPGSIDRLSIAVLVDMNAGTSAAGVDGTEAPADDQARIDRLTQLVRDAVGFNADRGDSVNIINEPFILPAELLPVEALPVWQQAWVPTAAKQFGAGIIVILLIFGVLRPAMKSVVSSQGNLPNRTSARLTGDTENGENVNSPALSPALASPSNPNGMMYQDNLNLAQNLVKNEPAKAARMIQNWMAND